MTDINEAQKWIDQDRAHRAAVYCLTSPSGKQYIGVTNDLSARFNEHSVRNTLIGKVIRRYGRESMIMTIIALADRPEAYQIEAASIVSRCTMVPGGYNRDSGGTGGYYPSDDIRRRISKKAKSRIRAPHSTETKSKMAKSHFGKKRSAYHIEGIASGVSARHRSRHGETLGIRKIGNRYYVRLTKAGIDHRSPGGLPSLNEAKDFRDSLYKKLHGISL